VEKKFHTKIFPRAQYFHGAKIALLLESP